MATGLPGSARTTTHQPIRRAKPGRSTSGRSAWASTTSSASSAAMPTSGSRTCSATPRRFTRMSTVPAYADHEIGRVIQQVEDMGKLDNTLIIYIAGDNGNSAEGSLIGTPNEVASL